jgi:splicing factor 3A subunit 3
VPEVQCPDRPHAPKTPPSPACRQYLSSLLDYTVSFYERTQPLAQLQRQLAKLEEELKAAFEAGTVPGWEDRGMGQGGATAEELGVDLDAFDSVEEVEIMGARPLGVGDRGLLPATC